jgi:hypothetical protein
MKTLTSVSLFEQVHDHVARSVGGAEVSADARASRTRRTRCSGLRTPPPGVVLKRFCVLFHISYVK